jgi:sugar transferase (PEP-CTERM/EpsH1 system associated)
MSATRLLYIAHRIPYPPNKGDKIRSYNEALFLSRRFEVDVVCFVDGPEDDKHLKVLQGFSRTVTGFRRSPWLKLWRLATGFLAGRPLSAALYDHRGMRDKVRRLIREHEYARIVVFSGQMAQYIPPDRLPRTVLDYCDVDSHKWDNYADRLPFYAAWFYRLEARRLFACENDASRQALATLFITPSERQIYLGLGGEGNLLTLGNGVDTAFFAPNAAKTEPGRILFTGAMDYFPNEEGVAWFAKEVFPFVRKDHPQARFVIAGSNPSLKVRNLARCDGVDVTGFVPDMRAEQARAHIVVVPLRIARGMQNKVLEAMACGKAVVVGKAAMGGIHAEHGRDLFVAETPEEFRAAVSRLLSEPGLVESMGKAARAYILAHLSWETNLEHGLLPLLAAEGPGATPTADEKPAAGVAPA